MDYTNYPEKALWDMPMKGIRTDDGKVPEKLPTLRQNRWGSVTNDFDLDEHINSEDGMMQARNWRNVIMCSDEMNPQVLSYWRNLGWEKTLHNADNREEKWSCFMPLSASKPENKLRQYPLYFVLHGGKTPPFEMEGYGYIEPTAKDEPIVIIPQDFTIEGVLKLYKYAVDHFPVDRSRVYVTSYCGGARANWVGMRYPEIFAAIAPAGNPLRENYKPILWYPDYERLRRLSLPCIHLDGLDDATQLLPVYADGEVARAENPDYPGKTYDMPLGKRQYKVNCLRDLLYCFDCKDVTAQEVYACRESDDEVYRKVGVPADETEIRTIYGRKHYIAKFRNGDGNLWLQIAGIESMGHFPNGSLGVLAWDFLSKFRRNMQTGRIEVIGQDVPAYTRPLGDFDPDRYLHDYGSREYGYNTAWKGHMN